MQYIASLPLQRTQPRRRNISWWLLPYCVGKVRRTGWPKTRFNRLNIIRCGDIILKTWWIAPPSTASDAMWCLESLVLFEHSSYSSLNLQSVVLQFSIRFQIHHQSITCLRKAMRPSTSKIWPPHSRVSALGFIRQNDRPFTPSDLV